MRLRDPLDDVFRTRSHIRVLRALTLLPEGIEASAREISRRSRISHPTASTVLDRLTEQGLVQVRRTLWADEYRLNMQHVLLPPLRKLIETDQQIFDQVVAVLDREIRKRAAWISAAFLYGSAAWGEMEPDSDLDIAVIGPKRQAASTERALAPLGDLTQRRFGNRANVLIGSGSVVEMAQPGHPGYRLWKRIAKDGVSILTSKGSVDAG